MYFFIILFAFGLWGSIVMGNKNRSSFWGFVLGFLFGILGIIVCYSYTKKGGKDEINKIK